MTARIITALGLIITIALVVPACAGSRRNIVSDVPTEEAEDFLPRPRFDKPVPRPLNRVLLTWDGIDGADGYEVQLSRDSEFQTIDTTWTIKGSSLEIPVASGTVVFLRIRAFKDELLSGWSLGVEVHGENS